MKSNSTAPKLEQENKPTLQIVKAEEVKTEVINEVKPEAPAEQPKIEVKVLSIEEIKRKNEVLRRLMSKYEDTLIKLRRVENFNISSDRETASILVTDANGEDFQSNSPKTIGKLIEFWTDEFKTALSEIEKEIRENA